MPNPSSSKRSWRRTRRQLTSFWDRIPRGAITVVSFSILIIIGLVIIFHRQSEDLTIGCTVITIGLLGALWPIWDHYREHVITRKKVRDMRRK